jgi:hypothetical protein
MGNTKPPISRLAVSNNITLQDGHQKPDNHFAGTSEILINNARHRWQAPLECGAQRRFSSIAY